MLARKSEKDEVTLPKAILTGFEGVDCFDVSTDGRGIVLRPVDDSRGGEVRGRVSELNLTDDDVARAVWWVRGRE
jgi:hypothetical protein